MAKNEIEALPPPDGYRNKYHGIDPLVVSIALKAARQAVGKGVMATADLPDLEQELILAALNAMQSFDPAKGNKGALIKTAVNRELINQIRYRCRECRDYRLTSSLNLEFGSEDSEFYTLQDMVTSDGTMGSLSLEQVKPFEQEMDNSGIQEIISKLPEKLQNLCLDMQYMSVRQAAAKNGISAGTLGRRINEIRNILEDFT